ncbi:MAG: hypothetical protein AAF740_14265 [Bacteroidota bacterium]
MKRLHFFLGLIILELLLVVGVWAIGLWQEPSRNAQLSQRFLLTDPAFSTESRHTRHLSTPEYIAPFQDFPAYLEHFPSSSFFYAETPQPR